MTHFKATQLLTNCRDKVHLMVVENRASEYQHFGAATTSIVTVKTFLESIYNSYTELTHDVQFS